MCLLGGNASGKSTVLKTILGVCRPRRGTVKLEGQRIDGIATKDIVSRGVAIVPENRRIFPRLTVLENLEMGGYIGRARKLKEDNLQWVFQMFPVLKQRLDQLAGTLSGGEQQMLAIARGLMSDPKLLLVDELSMGLAPIIVKNIYKTLKEINKSRHVTILVVEQNVRLALEVADRGYVIENGRITMEGKGKDLLASDEIKKAYLAIG